MSDANCDTCAGTGRVYWKTKHLVLEGGEKGDVGWLAKPPRGPQDKDPCPDCASPNYAERLPGLVRASRAGMLLLLTFTTDGGEKLNLCHPIEERAAAITFRRELLRLMAATPDNAFTELDLGHDAPERPGW